MCFLWIKMLCHFYTPCILISLIYRDRRVVFQNSFGPWCGLLYLSFQCCFLCVVNMYCTILHCSTEGFPSAPKKHTFICFISFVSIKKEMNMIWSSSLDVRGHCVFRRVDEYMMYISRIVQCDLLDEFVRKFVHWNMAKSVHSLRALRNIKLTTQTNQMKRFQFG